MYDKHGYKLSVLLLLLLTGRREQTENKIEAFQKFIEPSIGAFDARGFRQLEKLVLNYLQKDNLPVFPHLFHPMGQGCNIVCMKRFWCSAIKSVAFCVFTVNVICSHFNLYLFLALFWTQPRGPSSLVTADRTEHLSAHSIASSFLLALLYLWRFKVCAVFLTSESWSPPWFEMKLCEFRIRKRYGGEHHTEHTFWRYAIFFVLSIRVLYSVFQFPSNPTFCWGTKIIRQALIVRHYTHEVKSSPESRIKKLTVFS